MKHARLYEIMSGEAKDLPAALARLGLAILAPGYGLVLAVRNKLFDMGFKRSIRLDRPVISVGNITTGGTGKTPMVIKLAQVLIERGEEPAVLMRGYMAGQDGAQSDEAAEIRTALGDAVPVMPNPDRVEGAKAVLAEHPETTVFLLDDGFQHRRVIRDLDIVLIDATRPYGFGRLLPRGLLRESLAGLRRADAVILTRCDLVPPDTIAELDQQIASLTGQPVAAYSEQSWSGYRSDSAEHEAGYLQGKRVVGACAIGNPAAFDKMLRAEAGEVLALHSFDDHHAYTPDDVNHILTDAQERGAQAVVVTEKDWVKWAALVDPKNISATIPWVVRPKLGTEIREGASTIDVMIKSVFTD